MKTTCLLVLFFALIITPTCFAQVYVDGVAIDTINTPFCQLIGSNGGDLNRTGITIDYGQRFIGSAFSRQKIAGPDKRPINFNSTIDALNFMVKHGWELVFFQSGGANIYIYILQRKRDL